VLVRDSGYMFGWNALSVKSVYLPKKSVLKFLLVLSIQDDLSLAIVVQSLYPTSVKKIATCQNMIPCLSEVCIFAGTIVMKTMACPAYIRTMFCH